MDKKELGQHGEKLAEKFLRRKGFRIRARNYRCCYGEIDLIAQDRDTVVFVEVRTQSSTRYGTAYDVLKSSKKRHIARAASHYINQYRLMRLPSRYDFVQVIVPESGPPVIEHIENSF